MTFALSILTPDSEIFQGHVNSVQVPAIDGLYELLPGHAPIFIALNAGAVTVKTSTQTESWFVEGGICHMENNQCFITLKSILDMKSITMESLTTALKRNVEANFLPETRQLLEAQIAYKNTL